MLLAVKYISKRSILDVWLGSEYVSDVVYMEFRNNVLQTFWDVLVEFRVDYCAEDTYHS